MNRTISDIVYKDILPHLRFLSNKVDVDGLDLVIDGIKVFEMGDRFLPGKIINGATNVLTLTRVSDEFINSYKRLIKLTLPLYNETWGHMNYIQGIYKLYTNGLLEEMIEAETLETLKVSLDWRHFVNSEDLSLINKATNFYGVAFAIARYRELLGWDEGNYSEQLFNKLMEHIVKYSGEFSYMDETPGEGRFDRYSILIPSELCSTLMATGMEIPPLILKMLRQSASLCIRIANEKGNGFSYGRSIGAYGDSAVLEILAVAARLKMLNDDEMEIAYGFSTAIVNKFIDFWMDDETQSVNLWDKGRSTDFYRHKGRILGENISLCGQLIHINHQWEEIAYQVVDSKRWIQLMKQLPKHEYFCFAKGIYERGLAVIRRNNHVFMLPIINGGGGEKGKEHGKSYYYASTYLPAPQELKVLEVTPDSYLANLVPKIIDKQGREYMPISYINAIIDGEEEDGYKIIMKQDYLCQVGQRYPIKSSYGSVITEYIFKDHEIIRNDIFKFKDIDSIQEIYMEFSTFSTATTHKNQSVEFANGDIKKITISGLDIQKIENITEHKSMTTPHGQLARRVIFSNKDKLMNAEFKMSWKILFK